jgi:hypothetical protein
LTVADGELRLPRFKEQACAWDEVVRDIPLGCEVTS